MNNVLYNYFLKKRQLKAIKKTGDISYYISLPYHCPKCHWGTDDLTNYTTHLENHLIKRNKIIHIEGIQKEVKTRNKKRRIKIALILLGYSVLFILTFIFTGGLEALLQFATETSQAVENIIRDLIERLGGFLP